MEKRIKVSLNNSSVDDAIKQLRNIQKMLTKEMPSAIEDLAKQTKEKAEEFYNNVPFESHDRPRFYYEKTEKGYRVVAKGDSLLYEEFGTGDKGKASPHVLKGQFDLNPYNSGETIRPAKMLSKQKQSETGIKKGLYWTYKDPMTDEIVYTQGIPAGMFMYHADEWLKENYKKIIKEKVDDVLSKV